MSSDLRGIFESPAVTDAVNEVTARQLAREVGAPQETMNSSFVGLLRVAAISALADTIGSTSSNIWFKSRDEQTVRIRDAHASFECWRAYFDALIEVDETPVLDDLLMFASAGLIAERDHEVREELRQHPQRGWLDNLNTLAKDQPWMTRVRQHISASLLYVIRQENYDDIRLGEDVLRQLADAQGEIETEWLGQRTSESRDSATLLGLYHVGEAVMVTAQYLATGSVVREERELGDIRSELSRLMVKAEELFRFTGDGEQLLWLHASSSVVALLRASSLWAQASGISARVNDLLSELSRAGREQPVFSLLPGQQEALRKHLLDSSTLAMVLQMPTSSGKTLLAEFSILQTIGAFPGTSTRVVYVTPTRALATQVRRTLAEDLRPLGVRVAAAGSAFEDDPYEIQLMNDFDGVLVATPEKLDLLLRAHPDWFSSLRLVVVDEAHLIQEGERGARLELLLTNLRREQPDTRLLLLTPFMNNARQIAEWLSRERSSAISVHWRPTRVLLGMAKVSGRDRQRTLTVNWTDPYSRDRSPLPLKIPTTRSAASLTSTTGKVLHLADTFKSLGTSLAIYSASPAEAEKAALSYASALVTAKKGSSSPQMRVAIALARQEFGPRSTLAYCLQRGVAFHHSSLPPILRYLIEDQVRNKSIKFIAATSTLAQGMNFPVASILVHSVHKPYGAGSFSAAEFWNMAGRAGRVGLAEQGLVLFANPKHAEHLKRYASALSETLTSAVLAVLDQLDANGDLKQQYRLYPAVRPFIQYLAHAAATTSTGEALRDLETLIEQSLANHQVVNDSQSRKLRAVGRNYLEQLGGRSARLLQAADTTGLGTFSFDELYARLRDDPILLMGPHEVLNRGQEGLQALVDALSWIPEMDLAIGYGSGDMSSAAVAKAVQEWIDGMPVHEIALSFPGDEVKRVREAARYLNRTVSQTLSWGAHAFIRGWSVSGSRAASPEPQDAVLPSLIQYGVATPEAAVVSLLGIPRAFAEHTADVFVQRHGRIAPESAARLRAFVEDATVRDWDEILERSGVPGMTGSDARTVVRQMQGLPI